jgi:hypothetical protein
MDYNTEIKPMMSGLWSEYLGTVGVTVGSFKGKDTKNGPCPLCGEGTDRAHWHQQTEGRISLFCRFCGTHSAEYVAMRVTDWAFPDFVKSISNFLGIDNKSVTFDRSLVEKKIEADGSYICSVDEISTFEKQLTETPLTGLTFRYGLGLNGMKCDKQKRNCIPITRTDRTINYGIVNDDESVEYLAGGMTIGGYTVIGTLRGAKLVVVGVNWIECQIFTERTGIPSICSWTRENMIELLVSRKASVFTGKVCVLIEWEWDFIDKLQRDFITIFGIFPKGGDYLSQCNSYSKIYDLAELFEEYETRKNRAQTVSE